MVFKKTLLITTALLLINSTSLKKDTKIDRLEYLNYIRNTFIESYVYERKKVEANSKHTSVRNIDDVILTLLPGASVSINSRDLDLTSTITKSVNGTKIVLEKKILLYNPTIEKESVVLQKSEEGITFYIDNVVLFNGPFMAYKNNNHIEIKSFYDLRDVVPIRVALKNKKEDYIEFVSKDNYPPYYISKKLSEEKITNEDIVKILSSYNNLYGDYFNISHKTLVCTDQLVLPFLTAGVDFSDIIFKEKIPGNEYKHRNITTILKLLEKYDIKKSYVHYFHKGDKAKIFYSEGYDALKPESFGIDSFKVGQGIIFTRFYLNGPLKGKEQRSNVHAGVISEVKNGKISKVAMVTSRSRKPPYTNEIMATSDVDFYHWYENLRREYTGSDETPYTLTYRVLAIVDLPEIINYFKKIKDNNIENFYIVEKSYTKKNNLD